MHLDRTWIEGNIPHHGRMCLLDEVIEWDALRIRCRSGTHRLADHPLRSRGRLGVACGIEYAAQAMAVHGALIGGASVGGRAPSAGGASVGGRAPSVGGAAVAGGARGGDDGTKDTKSEVGFLASLRDVRLHVLRLDDIAADLICEALLVAGGHGSALYEFAVTAEARRLLSGRATVVFDANERMTK
jgi:predicted hotdog family 3-hydroxylacyl-ACP dehydratase